MPAAAALDFYFVLVVAFMINAPKTTRKTMIAAIVIYFMITLALVI